MNPTWYPWLRSTRNFRPGEGRCWVFLRKWVTRRGHVSLDKKKELAFPEQPEKRTEFSLESDKLGKIGRGTLKLIFEYVQMHYAVHYWVIVLWFDQQPFKNELRQQSYYCMDHLEDDANLKSNMTEKEKSKLDQWREKMKFTKKAISSQRLGIMGTVSFWPKSNQNFPICSI